MYSKAAGEVEQKVSSYFGFLFHLQFLLASPQAAAPGRPEMAAKNAFWVILAEAVAFFKLFVSCRLQTKSMLYLVGKCKF